MEPGTYTLILIVTDNVGMIGFSTYTVTALESTESIIDSLSSEETSILKEVFVFPNPAITPEHPTIRAILGRVDRVEITIYDITGQIMHSTTLGGETTGIANGEYYYDYTWSEPKASGIYYAVIHGKDADGSIIRGKTKFAVIK